ncbi:PulJ/GspJ family protein [Kineococcus rubinsiae]|uniref:PulJ/GspJ family protein n=1 Tax=Kineococcus rubinsiae TaxID=2609562 RepID=UPI001430B020|nr:prepilin-type N-terminal cleavage/methylation domain-containing protein [Kineococcus rubinsiae]
MSGGARFRPRGGDDDGVTLVELCIAMVISGVIAVLVATTTIQAFRIQRETTLRERDSTSVALAMDVLSKDLRQAIAPQVGATTLPAFSVATPTSLTVVTWVAADPVKVTYALTGGSLTRSVQQPDTAGTGARSTFTATPPVTTTTLARNITSTGLFAYAKSSDRTVFLATITGAADLSLVQSVKVDLTVDSDGGGRLPGTTLTNTVACLNL